jgi:pilus assembly protein Flp/PilA
VNEFGRTGELIERQREFSMRDLFSRFLSDQSGATAIEYALIAAGIALAIVTTVQTLGTNLNTKYSSFATALK